MTKDYNKVLQEAKQGVKPSADMLRCIRSQLGTGRFETDPYTLIHILGEAGDISSLPIVCRYTDFDSGDEESDDMIRRIAVQVVGRMWAVPEAFDIAVKKAFEDPSKYVRSVAATILGFLGARYPNLKQRSATALLQGLSQKDSLDPYTWESFYYGLLELFEIPAQQWPSVASRLNESQIRLDLIERARSLVSAGNNTRNNKGV
jgi:hypothetical protein